MDNNDILRRLRYAFDFKDQEMIDIMGLMNFEITMEGLQALFKREEDEEFQECTDDQLCAFLDGLIIKNRGLKEGAELPALQKIDNNIVLKKLRVALQLQSEDIISLMKLSGASTSKSELSALFRKKGHRNYKECGNQFLRNLIQGIIKKNRGGEE